MAVKFLLTSSDTFATGCRPLV